VQYGHELVRQIEFLRDSQSLAMAHLRNIRRYVGVIVLTLMSMSRRLESPIDSISRSTNS